MKPSRPRPYTALALAGLGLFVCASAGCAPREAPAAEARARNGPVPGARAPEARRVGGPDGRPLGLLRELDAAFPLYEFHLEASYGIEELLIAAADGASSGDGSGAGGSAAPARPGPDAEAYSPAKAAARPFACSCFAAGLPEGGRIFGRNFDWRRDPALVLFARPEGAYASVSMVDIAYLGYSASKTPLDDPAALARAWRLPFDGMNEKGLGVGMMAVDHAEGSRGQGRPRIGELGLIRVLLDRAASVAEALSLMENYDVELEDPPIHYFLADRSGDAAVVEYLGGRMRVFRSGKRWQLATNFLLAEVPEEGRGAACWRYARAAARLEAAGGTLSAAEAMDLLGEVSQPSTRWSAVYDLGSGALELALGRDYGRTLRLSLSGGPPAAAAP